MTLVLIEKGFVLEGWNPKIEDKQVSGIYIYIHYFVSCQMIKFSTKITETEPHCKT